MLLLSENITPLKNACYHDDDRRDKKSGRKHHFSFCAGDSVPPGCASAPVQFNSLFVMLLRQLVYLPLDGCHCSHAHQSNSTKRPGRFGSLLAYVLSQLQGFGTVLR